MRYSLLTAETKQTTSSHKSLAAAIRQRDFKVRWMAKAGKPYVPDLIYDNTDKVFITHN